MSQPFYNTVGLGGEPLLGAMTRAKTQDQKVLAYLQLAGVKAPASQIHRALIKDGHISKLTPITSIRRSLSNLSVKDGPVVKLTETRIGPAKVPEHLYSLFWEWEKNPRL